VQDFPSTVFANHACLERFFLRFQSGSDADSLAGFATRPVALKQPKIYGGNHRRNSSAGSWQPCLHWTVSPLHAGDWHLPVLVALAVGTRSVRSASHFMTLMVAYQLFKIHRQSFVRFVPELVPLGLPLFLGAAGFAWYNWARFGSFLETGFTYQLAAPYLQKHLNELFLPGYFFQNLYHYLFHPFAVRESFPFLYPMRGRFEGIFSWQGLPELYTAQAVTGFLCALPFWSLLSHPSRLAKQRGKSAADSGQNAGDFPAGS
jgi:hypothetical protein